MRERKRSKQWLVFLAAAIAFHVFLLLYVKQSHFSIFSHKTQLTAENATRGSSSPDAILYIPLEIDEPRDNEPVERITEISDVEETTRPTDEFSFPIPGRPSDTPEELDDILGEASQALPQGPGVEFIKIPPLPLQITWPDTRDLKHCLGQHIDVRIQVDADGKILNIEADEFENPADCVEAALESARQIIFAPGTINGKSARMWTRIQIDFTRKK